MPYSGVLARVLVGALSGSLRLLVGYQQAGIVCRFLRVGAALTRLSTAEQVIAEDVVARMIHSPLSER